MCVKLVAPIASNSALTILLLGQRAFCFAMCVCLSDSICMSVPLPLFLCLSLFPSGRRSGRPSCRPSGQPKNQKLSFARLIELGLTEAYSNYPMSNLTDPDVPQQP